MKNFYKKEILKKSILFSIASGLIIMSGSAQASEAHNPFDDVPKNHWARQAITELVDKGVITGYTDKTFNGNAKITRFEMAQMVAKAMSKSEQLSQEEKNNLDKLSREFAEELENLNVRVERLEKRADKIEVHGEIAQKYNKGLLYGSRSDGTDDEWSSKYLQLNINAPIGNTGYMLRTQFETDWGSADFNEEEPINQPNRLTLGYVEGSLGKTGQWARLGIISPWVQSGFVSAVKIAGLSLDRWGTKSSTHFFAGRIKGDTRYDLGPGATYDWTKPLRPIYDDDGNQIGNVYSTTTNAYSDFIRNHKTTEVHQIWGQNDDKPIDPTGQNDYGGVDHSDPSGTQLTDNPQDVFGFVYDYNVTDTLMTSLGYYRYTSDAYQGEPLQIWSGMMNYKFDDIWTAQALYSHGNQDGFNYSYSVELQYKGNPYIDVSKPHNFGAFIGYRRLGPDAMIKSGYDAAKPGQEGIEAGIFYTFGKNILYTLKYFDGTALVSGHDRSRVYTALEYFW